MRDKYYLGTIGNDKVIIAAERSGIGYVYPRVFVNFDEIREVTNRKGDKCSIEGFLLDLTTNENLFMSTTDFQTWCDDNIIKVDSIEDICSTYSINYKGLCKYIENYR